MEKNSVTNGQEGTTSMKGQKERKDKGDKPTWSNCTAERSFLQRTVDNLRIA
jgi:hypothetical protein